MRATLVGQSGSPKPLCKATTNNSAYRGDWRSPGAPITSKFAFYFDGLHIFKNVGRPGPQRQPRGTPRKLFGSSGVVSWRSPGPPLGGLRAPKGTPKSLQGRGQYEASDLKLTQTKASELKLHCFFPQGHWSSRAEAELAKRKQF